MLFSVVDIDCQSAMLLVLCLLQIIIVVIGIVKRVLRSIVILDASLTR